MGTLFLIFETFVPHICRIFEKNFDKSFRLKGKKACVFRIDAILLECKWRKVVISGLKWSESGSIPRSYKVKEIF